MALYDKKEIDIEDINQSLDEHLSHFFPEPNNDDVNLYSKAIDDLLYTDKSLCSIKKEYGWNLRTHFCTRFSLL